MGDEAMTIGVASVRIFVDDLSSARIFYRDVVGLPEVWAGGDAVVFSDQPMVVIERRGRGGKP